MNEEGTEIFSTRSVIFYGNWNTWTLRPLFEDERILETVFLRMHVGVFIGPLVYHRDFV